MKNVVKIAVYIVLCCIVLWILLCSFFWIRMHSRLDTSHAIEKITQALQVTMDELTILNEARYHCPVIVVEYHGDRTKVLNSCESLIPPLESMNRLVGRTRCMVMSAYQVDFDRVKKRVSYVFKRYGISLDDSIEGLFYVNPCEKNAIVIVTRGRIFVLYFESTM